MPRHIPGCKGLGCLRIRPCRLCITAWRGRAVSIPDISSLLPSVYILGAGFSRPAGLPLGSELFAKGLHLGREKDGDLSGIETQMWWYQNYKRAAFGVELDEESIDVEDFMSFVDLRLKLGLSVDATYIDQGYIQFRDPFKNWMRYFIAWTIHLAQEAISPENRALYIEFAKRLKPGDIVITFNYDTLLESALEEVGREYRHIFYAHPGLNWRETSQKSKWGGSKVILLKMHGSIDWFDKSYFLYCNNGRLRPYPDYKCGAHPIFDSSQFELRSLVGSDRSADDPLSNVYRVENLKEYFSFDDSLSHDVPLVVSPSYHKLLFINPLLEFWHGLGSAGTSISGLTIIGYSLPLYDDYARLALYYLAGRRTKVVDYLQTPDEIQKYRENYKFLNWDNAECHFDGFNMEAIKMIFDE